MRPTPEEVLQSISYTFDEFIQPSLTDALAVSYGLTISNMLRQVMLSLQHEERLIGEDTVELRSVVEQAESFLGRSDPTGHTVADIPIAVVAPGLKSPAASQVARESWRSLRGQLEFAIKRLLAIRPAHRHDPEYQLLRQRIRDYLDRSLGREKFMIDGAFTLARR